MKTKLITITALTCGLIAHSASAFTQLSASQDSDVYFGSGFPTGSTTTLGISDNADYGGGNHGQSSLVEFDLSSVVEPVTTATLWLYVEPIPVGGFATFSAGNVNLFTQAADWNVITLTGASFSEGNDLGDIAITQESVWVSYEVTTTVQDWISGALDNHGFLLSVTDFGGTGTQFASMETGAYGPVLAINGVPALVPEPSAYAAILGLVSIAFAAVRRRKRA